MSPELEYFNQFHFFARFSAWLTGRKKWKIKRLGVKPRSRLSVTYPVERWPVEVEGSVRAISSRAIRFATLTPPKEGEIVHLKVRLPQDFEGGEEIRIKSRVCKVMVPPGRRRYRVGCEAVDLSIETERKLEEFVRWNFSESLSA